MANELEYKKFEERLDLAIATIKCKCEANNLTFSEKLFADAVHVAETLFVRSEINYATRTK